LLFFAAVLAVAILSACSPPKKLPPWTVVCDATGRYSFTWDNGQVNQFMDPFASREDAREKMEAMKELLSRPRGTPRPTDGYKVCP
jgi:hypothetical protein